MAICSLFFIVSEYFGQSDCLGQANGPEGHEIEADYTSVEWNQGTQVTPAIF